MSQSIPKESPTLHAATTSKAVSSTVLDQTLWKNQGKPRPQEQQHRYSGSIHPDNQQGWSPLIHRARIRADNPG